LSRHPKTLTSTIGPAKGAEKTIFGHFSIFEGGVAKWLPWIAAQNPIFPISKAHGSVARERKLPCCPVQYATPLPWKGCHGIMGFVVHASAVELGSLQPFGCWQPIIKLLIEGNHPFFNIIAIGLDCSFCSSRFPSCSGLHQKPQSHVA
jgi:hypothetical protein